MGHFRMGAPVNDSVQLPEKCLKSMDYGRYNYGIHGGYFMVYKPLITWGAIQL